MHTSTSKFGYKYIATVVVMLLGCGSAGNLFAEPVEDPVHFDEIAAFVQSRANSLCWEMHRFHRHQPDFTETYRMAKEVWALSGSLRDLLRTGPVDSVTVAQQAQRIGEIFDQVERRAAKWEGIPASEPVAIPGEERRTVVTPRAGLDIDVPFFGLRLGTPGVVVRDDVRPRAMERRRPHVNARGSTRSLQRELDSTKIAVSYLMEDVSAIGTAPPAAAPGEPAPPAAGIPAEGSSQPAPANGPVLKISPPAKDAKTAEKP
jgi:hypothetical protein